MEKGAVGRLGLPQLLPQSLAVSHTLFRYLSDTKTFAAGLGSFIDIFQSFIMGADALAELESPIVEVDSGLQRTGRQFTFNDLNFEGFQLGGEQGGSSSQQSPFQSFPQFTSPASTSPSLGRARQPIPSR